MKGAGRTIRRRRREGKTDYKARLGFLKSGMPRVIVRKTNRYILGQIVVSDISQDRIILSVNSKDLLTNGWPKEMGGSLKSLPAAYLTGFLLGKKAKDIDEAILDIGLQRNIKKSRLYAFLKGLVDAGFKIGHKESVLPDEEMMGKNEKTANLISKIRSSLEEGV